MTMAMLVMMMKVMMMMMVGGLVIRKTERYSDRFWQGSQQRRECRWHEGGKGE